MEKNTHINTYLTFVIWDAELQKNLQNADLTSLKVSKFQNWFMKSLFLPEYEPNFVRITSLYCAILQGKNPYNFWFIFWQKRWLHKTILKFSDLYTTINKITQLYKKQTIYYHLTYWLDHIILVVHQLGFSIYIFKVVNLLLNTCRDFFFIFVSES